MKIGDKVKIKLKSINKRGAYESARGDVGIIKEKHNNSYGEETGYDINPWLVAFPIVPSKRINNEYCAFDIMRGSNNLIINTQDLEIVDGQPNPNHPHTDIFI